MVRACSTLYYVRFKDSGEETDVLQDGERSCAFFVSGLLTIIGGLDAPHSIVKTISEKLIKQGWEEVESNSTS